MTKGHPEPFRCVLPEKIPKKERLIASRIYVLTEPFSREKDLERFVKTVMMSGADIIQYRNKSGSRSTRIREVSRIRDLLRGWDGIFLVNDDVETAALVGADGVHLGQDDMSVAAARDILGTAALIGKSVHSPSQARAAEEAGADYLGVGPVFSAVSKGRPEKCIGVETLKEVCVMTDLPVFAIGGIKLQNISEVKRAGVSRVAVMTSLTRAKDPARVLRKMKELLL